MNLQKGRPRAPLLEHLDCRPKSIDFIILQRLKDRNCKCALVLCISHSYITCFNFKIAYCMLSFLGLCLFMFILDASGLFLMCSILIFDYFFLYNNIVLISAFFNILEKLKFHVVSEENRSHLICP